MNSKKCDQCGNVIFIDQGDQCPKDCPNCGHEINPHYEENKVVINHNGPTVTEYVDAGYQATAYPPEGFSEKPLSKEDKLRIDEMSAAETKYNDLLEEHKALKATHEKMIADAKAANNAKVPKEEKVKA